MDTPLGSTLRDSIFLAVLFDERSFLVGAVRPELVITPFAERFKADAIITSLTDNFKYYLYAISLKIAYP